MFTVNAPLNSISVVIQHEDDWLQTDANNSRNFLCSQLAIPASDLKSNNNSQNENAQATISNEQYHPTKTKVTTRKGSSKNTPYIKLIRSFPL